MKNQKRMIAVFLSTILVFLFLANFVIYQAVTLALGNAISGLWLSVFLAIAGLSFIGSTFLGRNNYTLFTRIYSVVSMVWMGFFGYLFLASVLYILEFAFIGDPTRLIGLTLLKVIILVSLYGLFHAQQIRIKHVEVVLQNLPEAWKNKKAVFISDLHIGQINGRKSVERIIQKIQKIKPDIVLIGGDLFDGSAVAGIVNNIDSFKELTPALGTYFILGNHEGYGTMDIFLKKIKEVGIKPLRDEKIVIDGLQLIGVDYKTTASKADFTHVLAKIAHDTSLPSILLKHEPRHNEVAEQAGISLQLSGHTHKAQQWPYEYMARMVYGKFAYGLNNLNATLILTSSGAGTWGPPLRIGTDSEIVVITFI